MTIKEILMKRDEMSAEEAEMYIKDAQMDLFVRLEEGEIPDDICEEWFGLEPDYLFDLMDGFV